MACTELCRQPDKMWLLEKLLLMLIDYFSDDKM